MSGARGGGHRQVSQLPVFAVIKKGQELCEKREEREKGKAGKDGRLRDPSSLHNACISENAMHAAIMQVGYLETLQAINREMKTQRPVPETPE